jgi:anti-sigma factor RsiW
MSRFQNAFSQRRASLSLLAAGVLSERDSALLEKHLAACEDCQNYYGEMRRMAVPLAGWENAYSKVEADQAVQARWAKDFAAALSPDRPAAFRLIGSMLEWGRDLVWPYRRIWTGFAAVWLAILAVNFSMRDPAQSQAMNASRPSREMVRAFLEAEGFLAGRTQPNEGRMAEPPKPGAPSPGSEWPQQKHSS